MKKFFGAIGYFFSAIVVYISYFFWTLATLVMYRPRYVYENKETKKLLKGPCILIANHTSHLDGSFIPQAFFGHKVNVLVTAKWYNKKKLHWIFSKLRYISIDLTRMDNSWMDKAKEALEKGEPILIFPEGALERNGYVEEFQPGFLMLARSMKQEIPIIPLAISGGYQPFKKREQIVIGNPLDFDVHAKGRPSVIMKEGAALYKKKIEDMLQA